LRSVGSSPRREDRRDPTDPESRAPPAVRPMAA
jgi:hypothetical protein